MKVFSPCAEYLTQQLALKGIKNIVLCPGSRNAPLVDAINNNGKFNLYTETDERNAGFVTLGLTLSTNVPTAVVCTSGSAVLNLLPALSEAFHQQQCIIALTCDRPTEWIGQQDSQTIDHISPLKAFCPSQAQLQNDDLEQHVWYNSREINRCLNSGTQAPIHINIPLADPLYTKTEYQNSLYAQAVHTKKIQPTHNLNPGDLSAISHAIDKAQSIVIACGQLAPEDAKPLSSVLQHLQDKATLIAENTANLNLRGIRTIDPWVMAAQSKGDLLQPDIILSIGGHFVSKKLKHLIRACHNSKIWRIGTESYYPDTFKHLDLVIPINPCTLFKQLQFTGSKKHTPWEEIYANLNLSSKLNNATDALADLDAYHYTCETLLQNHDIVWHFGNSSSIRYAQLFPYSYSAQYYANRGVSGIEGCISTAKGIALAQPNKTNLLMIGDLAFGYNLNGLQNLPPNLKIILVNNSGGNIFRLIDGPDSVNGFENFVECQHNTNHHLAIQHFGIVYLKANNLKDYQRHLKTVLAQEKSAVLEVFTNRLLNKNILKTHLQQFTNGKQENLEDN